MTPAQADAMLHRLIKRMLTAKGTSSDHLLILADWLDEAGAAASSEGEAVYLFQRASELRRIAPMLADPPAAAVGGSA